MKPQQYTNHVRYYYPHHFLFYPIVSIAAGLSVYFVFKLPSTEFVWLALAAQFLLLAWLSFMLRQHYALTNQDRIVRLELRLRYYILTGKQFEEIEKKLSLSRVLALRFASDEEFLSLIDKAMMKNLSADAIKKSVIRWQPDHMRV